MYATKVLRGSSTQSLSGQWQELVHGLSEYYGGYICKFYGYCLNHEYDEGSNEDDYESASDETNFDEGSNEDSEDDYKNSSDETNFDEGSNEDSQDDYEIDFDYMSFEEYYDSTSENASYKL